MMSRLSSLLKRQALIQWQRGALYHGTKSTLSGKALSIDLRSDTVTSPSPGMREAIAAAVTGDDVYGEDPTVNELEELMASITGKEAALFVPTGTMGNLCGILANCTTRGAEVLLGDASHVFLYEQGGIAQLGGIHSNTVPTDKTTGQLPIQEIVSRIRTDDVHNPTTELICLENTHCALGGRVLQPDYFRQVYEAVSPHGIAVHLDGARLFNAVAAIDSVPEGAREYLQYCKSASMCLSKGIGCPAGSVVVSDAEFIKRCRRIRKALGGGMRQVGVLAAAALYSLKGNFIGQLKRDHDTAVTIAQELSKHEDLFSIRSPVESNMVMVNVKRGISAEEFSIALEKPLSEDDDTIVRCQPWGESLLRVVAHCDVNREMALQACHKMVKVAQQWKHS